jgi:FdhE protein
VVTPTIISLEQLASADPAVAPLARLQAAALRAAEEPSWEAGIPQLTVKSGEAGAPLLHGVTLAVEIERQRELLRELVAVLAETASGKTQRLEALLESQELDVPAVLVASLRQDDGWLEALAVRVEVDPAVLAVVAQTAALPLLVACGRQAATVPRPTEWAHGYCPICAAWPILAEVRGLERTLFLRCGRCASEWRFEHRRCAYCGIHEQGAQGYFAAEQERETRQAVTCERCQGYLKTQTTLGRLDLAELLLRDLESLELDLAALEHDYRRPEAPGWNLAVHIEPINRRNARWWRW